MERRGSELVSPESRQSREALRFHRATASVSLSLSLSLSASLSLSLSLPLSPPCCAVRCGAAGL